MSTATDIQEVDEDLNAMRVMRDNATCSGLKKRLNDSIDSLLELRTELREAVRVGG